MWLLPQSYMKSLLFVRCMPCLLVHMYVCSKHEWNKWIEMELGRYECVQKVDTCFDMQPKIHTHAHTYKQHTVHTHARWLIHPPTSAHIDGQKLCYFHYLCWSDKGFFPLLSLATNAEWFGPFYAKLANKYISLCAWRLIGSLSRTGCITRNQISQISSSCFPFFAFKIHNGSGSVHSL